MSECSPCLSHSYSLFRQERGGGIGRANANKVDLNRNFPDQFHDGKDRASILKGRQPETLAAMTWIVSNPFVLSGKQSCILQSTILYSNAHMYVSAVTSPLLPQAIFMGDRLWPVTRSTILLKGPSLGHFTLLVSSDLTSDRAPKDALLLQESVCCQLPLPVPLPIDTAHDYLCLLIAPDDGLFRHLALTYASNHKEMTKGKACDGDFFPKGVTNGAAWSGDSL